MTNEQVGKYIRLLCIQHQNGFLTEKHMINICGTYDEDIYSKFKKDGEKYYNERMLEEAEKRSKYCESRRKNRKKEDLDDSIDISTTYEEDMNNISKTYVPHMENRNENINEDIDINEKGVIGGKTKTEGEEENLSVGKKKRNLRKTHSPAPSPTLEEFKKYFFENGFDPVVAERAWNGYVAADWHDTNGKKVLNWKQKCQNVWFRPENQIPKNGSEIPKNATNLQAGMIVSGPLNTFLGRCEGYRRNYGKEPPDEWFEKFNRENGTNLQPKLAQHG